MQKASINLNEIGIKLLILISLIIQFCFNIYSSKMALLMAISFLAIMLIWTLHNEKKIRIIGISVWYFVFFLASKLSNLWALQTEYVTQVTIILVPVLLNGIAYSLYINNEKRWNSFLKIYIISQNILAIYVLITNDSSLYGTSEFGINTGFYFNHIAQGMALALIGALYLMQEKKKYAALIVLPILVIWFSGSRKALLVVILGFVLYLTMTKRTPLRKMAVLFAIFIVLFSGYNYILANAELYIKFERFIKIFSTFDSHIEQDVSATERLYFMEVGMNIFKEHPVIGVGVNNFKAYIGSIGYRNAFYSHNNYIELLSGLGIVGFTIYYGFFIKCITRVVKNFRRLRKQNSFILVSIWLLLQLILDYGNITYYFIQYQYILIMIYTYFNIKRGDTLELIIGRALKVNRRRG